MYHFGRKCKNVTFPFRPKKFAHKNIPTPGTEIWERYDLGKDIIICIFRTKTLQCKSENVAGTGLFVVHCAFYFHRVDSISDANATAEPQWLASFRLEPNL